MNEMRFEQNFGEPPPACMSKVFLKSLVSLFENDPITAKLKMEYVKIYKKAPRGRKASDKTWLKSQIETKRRRTDNEVRKTIETTSKKRKRVDSTDDDTESENDDNVHSKVREPFFQDILQWPKIDHNIEQIVPSEATISEYSAILNELREFECVPVYFWDNGAFEKSVLWKRSDGVFFLRSNDCDDVIHYIGLHGEDSVMDDFRNCSLYMDDVSMSQKTIIKNESDLVLLKLDNDRRVEYWLEEFQKLWDSLRKAVLEKANTNVLLNDIYDLVIDHRTYFRKEPWLAMWNHWTYMRVDLNEGSIDEIIQRIHVMDEIMYKNYRVLSSDIANRVC